MFFPVVLLLDSQGTLDQVLLLAVVTQVSMRNAKICQSHCYFGMFLPVVLLVDSQGTLEQVLLLAVVTQVSMRIAQICQSHCYFGMFLPVVLLDSSGHVRAGPSSACSRPGLHAHCPDFPKSVLLQDSQGTLEQVLPLPGVA